MADNWLKRHVHANGLRSEFEIRRQLDRYVYPKWKDRPFTEIRRNDVSALLDGIAECNVRISRAFILDAL